MNTLYIALSNLPHENITKTFTAPLFSCLFIFPILCFTMGGFPPVKMAQYPAQIPHIHLYGLHCYCKCDHGTSLYFICKPKCKNFFLNIPVVQDVCSNKVGMISYSMKFCSCLWITCISTVSKTITV